jgi:hypothetical protein
MKTSKSSVFISGIDDVEKVFSYPHPAVKQSEYQVEVPLLEHCSTLHFFLDRPKADLHKYNHKDALAVVLEIYFLAPLTTALRVAPALKAGALLALIFIASPVPGFQPFRAEGFLTSNVPKPTRATLSPFFRVEVMMSISAPMALSASTFVLFVFVAIAAINSVRFMMIPFWWFWFVKLGHYISK